MNEKTDIIQWKIRHAIQRLQRQYYKYPWMFMTEADVQCNIYHELHKYDSKVRKTVVKDVKEKILKDWKYQIYTKKLHSELSSSTRRNTEFVDLCIIDPAKVVFWIKKTKFSRDEGRLPVWSWDWKPKDSIGIEIKFNRQSSKTDSYSHKTKRTRRNLTWQYFGNSMKYDLKKLKRYKRGWLIFVDHHSLFNSKAEWRAFMDRAIRDTNYGSAKKTLNAYYLCPKSKIAWSFKPPGVAF